MLKHFIFSDGSNIIGTIIEANRHMLWHFGIYCVSVRNI